MPVDFHFLRIVEFSPFAIQPPVVCYNAVSVRRAIGLDTRTRGFPVICIQRLSMESVRRGEALKDRSQE